MTSSQGISSWKNQALPILIFAISWDFDANTSIQVWYEPLEDNVFNLMELRRHQTFWSSSKEQDCLSQSLFSPVLLLGRDNSIKVIELSWCESASWQYLIAQVNFTKASIQKLVWKVLLTCSILQILPHQTSTSGLSLTIWEDSNAFNNAVELRNWFTDDFASKSFQFYHRVIEKLPEQWEVVNSDQNYINRLICWK